MAANDSPPLFSFGLITDAHYADAGERVLVCGHHPVLPEEAHILWNHRELLDVLDRHPCVIAFLCRHNHAGGFAEHNDRPFVTFRSMPHEPDKTAFSIIHVHPDRLVIDPHGSEVAREIPVAPVR